MLFRSFQLAQSSYFLEITQHYTPLSPLQGSPEGSDQRGLSVVGLLNRIPVLGPPYRHVYAVSFTHAAWIERYEEKRSRWRGEKERRSLKVLSFLAEDDRPGPCVVGSFPCGMKLDIPEKIIDDAVKLIIEPTICSIFIITNHGKLHKFRFA